MNRHHAIDGLTSDLPFAEAVQLMVWTRFREMWKHRKETVRGDAEALHDMRVGSRRLQAALDLAGPAFSGKEYARFRRTTERLTRELGAVRDADVLLQSLDTLAKEENADACAAIAPLVDLVTAERLVKRRQLVDFLDELDACGYAEVAARLWRDR